ncbi:MAG: DUF1249 domain-containing protein [Parahaliea sp.]
MSAQGAGKRPFKIDIVGLHALCEANYARLLRLFPDYEHSNHREFRVGSARVEIEVIERCRYTTIFRLRQHRPEERWLGLLRMEARAYHDVGMLEIGSFQSHRRAAPRYDYPNAQMLQEDEKIQQNRFLAQWLEHCLAYGGASVNIAFSELL